MEKNNCVWIMYSAKVWFAAKDESSKSKDVSKQQAHDQTQI